MKILTLNTHSLQEANYEEKLDAFLKFIFQERPDIIALQEVNQSADAAVVHDNCGMVMLPGCKISLKEDNHGLRVACRLRGKGFPVSWAWLPIKKGYGKYDEGLAMISLSERISHIDICTISRTDDYRNWRTRKTLGVQIENHRDWFYTVHMGWWQDEEEPFEDQWRALNRHLAPITRLRRIWLMGDFNSPAEVRCQGYDLMAESGWKDTYHLAEKKDEGFTAAGAIDGWRERIPDSDKAEGMRIDHIWCSRSVPVKYSKVVFNGKNEPVVSDHFGLMIELKGET